MENKAHAFTAGLFTIALLIAMILIGIWLNRDRTNRVPYEIVTKQAVQGLNPQAAVRYRGLDVGRVDSISFDPEVAGQIVVHLSVTPETPITRSTFSTLGYQGLTGIAYVQLDDDGSDPVRIYSTKKQIARLSMRPSLLESLQTKGFAILQQTNELAKRINILLGTDNQKALMNTVNDFDKAANRISGVAEQLQPALEQLPGIEKNASQTLGSVSKLAQDASKLSNNLNSLTSKLQAPNGAVDKLTDTIDRIGSAADVIEREGLPLARKARTTMDNIDRSLDRLSDHPQSILFGTGSTPGPGEAGFNDSGK